jgi:hypothetical protein
MKAMLSTKIKALLDTLNYESMGQNTNRCEVERIVGVCLDLKFGEDTDGLFDED